MTSNQIIILSLLLLILLVILYDIFNKNTESFDNVKTSNNICCLYAYYEKDNDYKNNFEYFLQNGILNDVDYYIIINGKSSVILPEQENIIIFYRENKGYDFGAYSYTIPYVSKNYDYYFFMNTSVCGPYLKNSSKNWTEYFIELFNNDDVKVVGTTINIHNPNGNNVKPLSHIQSMFFCINAEYYNYLLINNFFNEDEINNMDFQTIIDTKEIGLSQIALNNNWNINCILPGYKDLDYRIITTNINESSNSHDGDPYYNYSYFEKTIDKYDVIFFKTNRKL
jgi:hypothetical protein